MRTFAQKPKAPQQGTPAKSAIPGRAHFGQSREVNSIFHLQRTVGNQAVQRLLQANAEELKASSATTASTRFPHDFSRIPVHHRSPENVQAKLMGTSHGDIYEQEADRVSEQVMRMSESQPQHACPCGGECPRCKTDQLTQERLQSKGSLSRGAREPQVPRIVDEALRSHGQSLDARTRGVFETRFGQDFGSVRIHIDNQAIAAARSVNARAFTVREDIVFDRGEYSPGTSEGRLLLAHELVHVVQQLGARVPIPLQTRDNNTGRADINAAASAKAGFNAASAQYSPRVVLPAPPMVARGEKWDAFWGVGPLDAMKAKELADKSLKAAQQTSLPGLHNGPADAWRHCYWNCLMTDEIGRDQAKFVADNHEKHGGGPAIENLMDSRNNWEGRECGGSNCDPCCQTKLDTGVLDVIEGGKMVPSKTTPRTGGKQSDKYEYL